MGFRVVSARRAGVVAGAVLAAAVTVGVNVPAAGADSIADALPTGVDASLVVFDRDSGTASVQFEPHKQFRSASVVKVMIALDYLESHDPAAISADDKARLEAMLRSSDDDAASYLWVENGWDGIVTRTVAKLGLTDTAPPASRGMWGYTAISAADVVTVYRYILDRAAPAVRDFIMDNLHASTKCGQDGFDQSFGLARAVDRPRAVKQGWSGFGDAPTPDKVCAPGNPKPPIPQDALSAAASGPLSFGPDGVREKWNFTQGTPPAGPAIDLTRRAMHTTGTVGVHDDRIVALLTLEPTTTSWEASAQRITLLTKAADVADWGLATGLGDHDGSPDR